MAFENKIDTRKIPPWRWRPQIKEKYYELLGSIKDILKVMGKNIMQLLFVECTTLFLWPCVTCINNTCKLKSLWYLHKNIIIWIFTYRLQEIQKVWTNCTVCLSCNPRFWPQIFVSLETRPATLVDVYNINLLIVVAKYKK